MRINSAQDLRDAYPGVVAAIEAEARAKVRADALARRVKRLEARVQEEARKPRTAADMAAERMLVRVLEEAKRRDRTPEDIWRNAKAWRIAKELFGGG
ncbi:hypothetical protein ACFLSF_02785 [Candidatus Bipolaricaulota bacterium]